MEDFKDILKELINEQGLSLRKLAENSKVSANQYSKYLKGSFPSIKVAIRIAQYFKCSLDYLFGLSNEKVCKNYREFSLQIFIEKYLKLLDKNNITHYKFAQENNLSESCLRHWKYGDIPKTETLFIIASKLYSSIDYLIGLD